MGKQRPTTHQQEEHRKRLDEIDRTWEFQQRSFLVHGCRPDWIGAGFALVLATLGVFFLAQTLPPLLRGEPVLRGALLLGLAFPVVGGYFAVLVTVQRLRLAAAERGYLRCRSGIRIEDCPRRPPSRSPEAARRAATEDAAGDYLLDLK